ncbi:MAG: hypothetical protein ACI85O_003644, partial [Saprospiraceae bacterium]
SFIVTIDVYLRQKRSFWTKNCPISTKHYFSLVHRIKYSIIKVLKKIIK